MKTFSRMPSESRYDRVDCTLCGADSAMPVWGKSELPFVKCRSCGLVYQNPMPDNSQLLERYDGEYFDYEIDNEEQFFKLMLLGLDDVGFAGEERRLLGQCGRRDRAPAFLDVGCATGKLIAHMTGRGWDACGVEVCEPAARYGIEKRGLDIRIGTLEDAGFADSSFDLIHCSHLIEHLTRPDLFLEQSARLLKPGGRMIVVTPDISGIQARLFGDAWRSAIADHMHLFSRKTLSRMMEANGFRILRSAGWGGLAAGTAPAPVKKAADRLVKVFGGGDVVCIMGTI